MATENPVLRSISACPPPKRLPALRTSVLRKLLNALKIRLPCSTAEDGNRITLKLKISLCENLCSSVAKTIN